MFAVKQLMENHNWDTVALYDKDHCYRDFVDDVIGFVIGNRESATKQNFIESDTKSELNNNIFLKT